MDLTNLQRALILLDMARTHLEKLPGQEHKELLQGIYDFYHIAVVAEQLEAITQILIIVAANINKVN